MLLLRPWAQLHLRQVQWEGKDLEEVQQVEEEAGEGNHHLLPAELRLTRPLQPSLQEDDKTVRLLEVARTRLVQAPQASQQEDDRTVQLLEAVRTRLVQAPQASQQEDDRTRPLLEVARARVDQAPQTVLESQMPVVGLALLSKVLGRARTDPPRNPDAEIRLVVDLAPKPASPVRMPTAARKLVLMVLATTKLVALVRMLKLEPRASQAVQEQTASVAA